MNGLNDDDEDDVQVGRACAAGGGNNDNNIDTVGDQGEDRVALNPGARRI
jgi:hypothetical protein